jgi:hypothetical protein
MEIIFFRNKANPDYYFIYKGGNNVDAQLRLERYTHTGRLHNSGYPKIDVEIAFVLKTDLSDKFFNYLADMIATNHMPDKDYNCGGSFRAWYEFKDLSNPQKWIESFIQYQREQDKKKSIKIQTPQATLFDVYGA